MAEERRLVEEEGSYSKKTWLQKNKGNRWRRGRAPIWAPAAFLLLNHFPFLYSSTPHAIHKSRNYHLHCTIPFSPTFGWTLSFCCSRKWPCPGQRRRTNKQTNKQTIFWLPPEIKVGQTTFFFNFFILLKFIGLFVFKSSLFVFLFIINIFQVWSNVVWEQPAACFHCFITWQNLYKKNLE